MNWLSDSVYQPKVKCIKRSVISSGRPQVSHLRAFCGKRGHCSARPIIRNWTYPVPGPNRDSNHSIVVSVQSGSGIWTSYNHKRIPTQSRWFVSPAYVSPARYHPSLGMLLSNAYELPNSNLLPNSIFLPHSNMV